MRKPLLALSLLALTVAAAPACATKKYVRTEVGQVNDKVSTLGTSVEQTQERVRQAEGKISEVDQKAVNAQQSAAQAQQTAAAANDAAAAVNARAEAIESANRRLLYEVVISEDQGKFRFGAAELPDEAKSAIDELVDNLKNQKSGVWIEIEGHTDNVGDKKFNERLGMARAEAVKRYLYEQHQVPLHKMNVITYGEDKPVAPNRTRDGRAQNRRVVIKVLA